jgi:hypothetical protein
MKFVRIHYVFLSKTSLLVLVVPSCNLAVRRLRQEDPELEACWTHVQKSKSQMITLEITNSYPYYYFFL